MAEIWDIYDEHKNVTGRTMERDVFPMDPKDFHLSVLAVVARNDGKFLITKRVMTKSWAAGLWEVSGGAVQAGETSKEAVLREVKEETGLDVSGFEGGFFSSYQRVNSEEGNNYFVDIYRFVGDFTEEDIVLQEGETDGFKIATLKEIQELGEQDLFLHYHSIKDAFLMGPLEN